MIVYILFIITSIIKSMIDKRTNEKNKIADVENDDIRHSAEFGLRW